MPTNEGSGTYRSGGKVHGKRSGKKDGDHSNKTSSSVSTYFPRTTRGAKKAAKSVTSTITSAGRALDERASEMASNLGSQRGDGTGTTGIIPIPPRGGTVEQNNVEGYMAVTNEKLMEHRGKALPYAELPEDTRRMAEIGARAGAEAGQEALQQGGKVQELKPYAELPEDMRSAAEIGAAAGGAMGKGIDPRKEWSPEDITPEQLEIANEFWGLNSIDKDEANKRIQSESDSQGKRKRKGKQRGQ